jgi:uncharacterized repeat protein (TIGR01451 family)
MSPHVRNWLLGSVLGCVLSLSLVPSSASGGPVLEIKPITWDIVGLDSNDVTVGPDTFPVAARVCNTGDADATNVVATIHFDAPVNSAHFNLQTADPLTVLTLPPGGVGSFYDIGPDRPAPIPNHCTDFYWNVVLTRDSSAYNPTNQTQLYHIEVTADGLGTVSTPSNRQLFIEKLISQNRNSVNSISGPTTVYIGNTYTYTVSAKTATGGYEQVVPTVNFPNTIFRILGVSATYAVPAAPDNTNNATYADACGWDPNIGPTPPAGTYRSCAGPENYPGGKAAGNPISTTITVEIIAGGTATVSTLIYDFSGSSYHYNSDFGTGVNTLTITATSAPAGPDLTIAKTHSGDFSRGQVGATYTITVSNDGTAATDGSTVTVTETPPAGLTPTAISGTGWLCTFGTLTCTRSDVLAAGASYDPITLTVDVASNAPASVTNSATVSGGGDVEPSNNTATDPTTILVPDLTITKTHSGSFFEGQIGATYTITVTNNGSAATDGSTVTVTETPPPGLTPTAMSGTGWLCTFGTLTCTRSDVLAAGSSYPPITLTVDVTAGPGSVTNMATVSGGGDADPGNNTASDPTTIGPPCPFCNNVTVVVNQNVTVDFNPATPTCTGDPDLCAFFTFDKSGPTPDTWKAIFDVGARTVLVTNGATITTAQVITSYDVPQDNNRRAPGIVIRSTCELQIDQGSAVKVASLNRPAGEIVLQVDGPITINGTVSNSVSGTNGVPGEITIASCCGDIVTGPQSQITTFGVDHGGSDINLLTCLDARCASGNITINGLVDASYKGVHASTINVISLDGAVTIDGNNFLGTEAGTKRPITSGVTVRSRRDPLPGTINIQAQNDITVLGNRILSKLHPNTGAVAVKTASSSPKGGRIDVRSIGGGITASDRAFDDANRYDASAVINLAAQGDIDLSVSGSVNDGAANNSKAVVSTQAGKNGTGGQNLLRAFSGGIGIGANAQVLADFSANPASNGTNLLTSCLGVTNNGTVKPPDLNLADDAGVCAPTAPTPLVTDCSQFGIAF